MYVTYVSGQAINPVARWRRGKGSYVASGWLNSYQDHAVNRGGRRRGASVPRCQFFHRGSQRGKRGNLWEYRTLRSLSSQLFLCDSILHAPLVWSCVATIHRPKKRKKALELVFDLLCREKRNDVTDARWTSVQSYARRKLDDQIREADIRCSISDATLSREREREWIKGVMQSGLSRGIIQRCTSPAWI